MKTRAIFLDKDGTVNVNVPYNVNPDLVELMPGAAEGLLRLQDAGFKLLLVSNQAGVAYGYFPESALDALYQRLQALLGEAGVHLSGFYYCPHHPQGTVQPYARACGCRKPLPGLIEQAAKQHSIDLAQSWFIGDILDDMEAGKRAGCRTVLVDVGSETRWELGPDRIPDYLTHDLRDAAKLIVARSQNHLALSCSNE